MWDCDKNLLPRLQIAYARAKGDLREFARNQRTSHIPSIAAVQRKTLNFSGHYACGVGNAAPTSAFHCVSCTASFNNSVRTFCTHSGFLEECLLPLHPLRRMLKQIPASFAVLALLSHPNKLRRPSWTCNCKSRLVSVSCRHATHPRGKRPNGELLDCIRQTLYKEWSHWHNYYDLTKHAQFALVTTSFLLGSQFINIGIQTHEWRKRRQSRNH